MNPQLLRSLRLTSGLSLRDLSEMTGVPFVCIHGYENGVEARPERVAAIMAVLRPAIRVTRDRAARLYEQVA